MGKRVFLGIVLIAAAFSAVSDYATARQKLATIEAERARPGTRIALSPQELNAYVRQELLPQFPPGVREPALELGDGAASGSALVDFAKVRRAQGKPPGWLMARLLEGERPVKVTARIQSGGGRATVDVQSVEVSGMTIDGAMLDYLIRNYLLPNYPQAKVGEPFELGHHIERLDIKPAAVGVVIGR